MKIGIIGAVGKAGSRIAREAVERGHEVTAIVRDQTRLGLDRVAVLEKDLFELKPAEVREFDVIVNAFAPAFGQEHLHVDAGNLLIDILKEAPNTRLIVVGGAGSLFVDDQETLRLVDSPGFPEMYMEISRNQAENLRILRETSGIRWTFVSPSAHFELGKRTGVYQKGKDRLLVNSSGKSYVSYEDYAVAIVDEIEHPEHENERFTVVSESE